jgi:uncharacterized protein YndB with AHSA1/START domain
MNDIVREVEAINRAVGSRRVPAGEGRSVVLRRRYDAPIEDVWDACSDPDRLKRWFLPVSGDFRVGGTFQIEGNASGEILRCQPPRLLAISWVYGDNPADEAVPDAAALEQSPEARRFIVLSSTAWGAALEAGGVATAEEAAATVERTTAFYAPDPGGDA